MATRFKIGSTLLAVAAVALLLLQPGKAQAHPQLVGMWVSVAPANANMAYSFDPGEYIGGGVWRGSFTMYWGNNPICSGIYELRVNYGTTGTLCLRDGVRPPGGLTIGDVDLGTRVMNLKGVTYRP